MKDNEFYRPAESGIGAQEMPAARDEFARRGAAPARPKGTRRQHGRLLQLLCGAAAVTVIAQAALPESAAVSSFAAPLRWEEVTLLGRPVKDVEIEDLTAAYGPGNVRSNSRSYTQQTEDGYRISYNFALMSNYYDSDEPNAGERYTHWIRHLTSTNPNLALEIRGLAIGMGVQEAMERIGLSENVWNLLTDLSTEYQKDDSALLQALTYEPGRLLEEYGIQTAAYVSFDNFCYRLSAGESRCDEWRTRGRDPYHGEWKVEIWFGRMNNYDENGDYLNTTGADVQCNRLRLTFKDGRLEEFYIQALGDPIQDDEPEPTPIPEPEEAVPYAVVLPDLLQWEEIVVAGIPFDQLTLEDVAAYYPGNMVSNGLDLGDFIMYEYDPPDIDMRFAVREFPDGSHSLSMDRYMGFGSQSYPDPEFRGLRIGMNIDDVLQRIGIPEEKWTLLGIDKRQGYAIMPQKVFFEDDTEETGCIIRINRDIVSGSVELAIFYTLDYEDNYSSVVMFNFEDESLMSYSVSSHTT